MSNVQLSEKSKSEKRKKLNLVVIGGGNGLSTLLSGLKKYVGSDDENSVRIKNLSAIVAVSDDGGSSGRLRDELQMLPPGDIRNCLVALSEDSHLLSKLFQYRFPGSGDLGGHSFGNLFLAALSEITGDFAEAVKLSSEVLATKGHIYPATVTDVHLTAELVDGTVIKGETNISRFGNSIKNLRLEPENCHPLPEVLKAIGEADIITIGPGSLFTSLLPPILVQGVAQAIAASGAKKFFVCNLMTQPGETDGFSARRHLDIIGEYAPEIEFDYVIVNNQPISSKQKRRYADEGAQQIGIKNSIASAQIGKAQIIHENLLDDGAKVRHNSDKLAEVILRYNETVKREKQNWKTNKI